MENDWFAPLALLKNFFFKFQIRKNVRNGENDRNHIVLIKYKLVINFWSVMPNWSKRISSLAPNQQKVYLLWSSYSPKVVTVFLNIATIWRPKLVTSCDDYTPKRCKFLLQTLIISSPSSKTLPVVINST